MLPPLPFAYYRTALNLIFTYFGFFCVEVTQKHLVFISYRKVEFVFGIGVNGVTYCFLDFYGLKK